MNQKLTTALTVLFATLMMTTPVAATPGSTTLVLGVDVGSPAPPSEAVRYETPNGDLAPGVFVEVGSSGDLDSLETWADASTDRRLIKRYNATNGALVAVQPADIKPSLSSWRTYLPGGESTISDLSYVSAWSWDRQVSLPDTPDTIAREDVFEKPSGAGYAEAVSGGKYTPRDAAYRADAPDADLNDTRRLVDADTVKATGAGVDVAVIDSGVNTGNGTHFGDGSPGSSMRVADAYDYVDDQSVNLSVSRENLTTELAKVGDPNGHGSWVSSAVLNAKSGIAPEANLMAYRALNSEGEGSTADIRDAISRSNAQGADIIVMSLGSPVYSEGMAKELKYALGPEGNVTGVFVAVGNSYQTTRYVSSPADVDGVLGVAATNAVQPEDAKRAYFSNVGPDTGMDGSNLATRGVQPDTAAPGMNIQAPVYSAPIADGGVETTNRLSGTSMAAPIAAGVGALLLDAQPGLVGDQAAFRQRMVRSGAHTQHIGLTESRGGVVNADRAINGWTTDATARNLTARTAGRDDANRWLAGDVGVRIATISEKSRSWL